MNLEAAGAVSESGFQAAPTGIQALSSGPKSRKITSLAGIFCNGSLTTAKPYPLLQRQARWALRPPL